MKPYVIFVDQDGKEETFDQFILTGVYPRQGEKSSDRVVCHLDLSEVSVLAVVLHTAQQLMSILESLRHRTEIGGNGHDGKGG